MLDLVKARLIKYFQSPLFYIAAAVSLASGIYGGVYCTYFKDEAGAVIGCPADDMWILTAIWADIVLVAMCAGREFSDGTIRNKIAVGHTKTAIFLAEVIAASIMTVIIYLLDILPTAIGGWFFISGIPALYAAEWFINIFLTFELTSIFSAAITFLLAKRAVSVVAAFALHFAFYIMAGATNGYYYNIDEPKTGTDTFYIMYDDGRIEETEQEFENSYYIEGFPKTLIQIEHAVNPMYGLDDAMNFGYITNKTMVDDHVIKQEQNRIRDLNSDVIKMLAYCIIVSFAGAYLFCKRDLK